MHKQKIRLNKFIAQAGICSRRQADELIIQGEIMVNQKIVTQLGFWIEPEKDKVFYQKKEIHSKTKKEYIVLNKPKGFVCSHRKFRQEENIYQLLPAKYQNFFCVGRLDKNSRGLILMTNDGQLTQELTHPKFEHEKEYMVSLNQKTEPRIIQKMQKGFDLPQLGQVKAKTIEPTGNKKVRIILTQGKKRQIREMFKSFGIQVTDLLRIRINNIKLGNLKEGEWKKIDPKQFYLGNRIID